MPRFVILLHELPPGHQRATHWDFMLEDGETLKTWALEEELQPGGEACAQQLADHRLDYLEYEGPISGGRGRVSRWDEGDFQWIEKTDTRLSVLLDGQRHSGVASFMRLPEEDGAASQRWSVSLRNS